MHFFLFCLSGESFNGIFSLFFFSKEGWAGGKRVGEYIIDVCMCVVFLKSDDNYDNNDDDDDVIDDIFTGWILFFRNKLLYFIN